MAHPTYNDSLGRKLPSVTTVLSKFKDPGGLMWWAWDQGRQGKNFRETTKDAADLGTMVHDMIETNILKGSINWDNDYDHRALKAYNAFLEWKSITNFEMVATETSLVHDGHGFGGTPDAVAVVNNELVVLDWKTSKRVYVDMLVQLSAYRALWEGGRMLSDNVKVPDRLNDKISGVHLLRVGKKHGGFHHHSWPIEVVDMAWEQFETLLRAYRQLKALEEAM